MLPVIEDLGRVPFALAHERMLEVLASIREGSSPGQILLAEHDPVFTAGRATPEEEIGDDVIRIERGGQITYHGPGQLVVYPILPLVVRDVRAWLQRLEAFGIVLCAQFGLEGLASQDGTGVFVSGQKVASIGIAIRHWINLHGIAINIDMDLAPFQRIRPCGLDPNSMSDLSRLAGRNISMDEAKSAAREAVATLLSAEG